MAFVPWSPISQLVLLLWPAVGASSRPPASAPASLLGVSQPESHYCASESTLCAVCICEPGGVTYFDRYHFGSFYIKFLFSKEYKQHPIAPNVSQRYRCPLATGQTNDARQLSHASIGLIVISALHAGPSELMASSVRDESQPGHRPGSQSYTPAGLGSSSQAASPAPPAALSHTPPGPRDCFRGLWGKN